MNRQSSLFLAGMIFLAGCSGSAPDLGVHNGELKPCGRTPNCVSSQAVDDTQAIPAIRFDGPRQEARTRLVQILDSEPRTRILNSEEDYIRVEFRSALLRFVDDVEFYFPEQQGAEQIIHVRSASRIGYSDLGVNRKRVERIRSRLSSDGQSNRPPGP